MKILRYNLLVSLLCLAHVLTAFSGEEARRSESKTFKVNKATGLNLENQFGKVQINTWDKMEAKIEVEIIATARNKEKAEKMLGRIEISLEGDLNSVNGITKTSGLSTRNGETFEVNYTVYVPAANPLTVINKFGDVYVDARAGKSDIRVAYGNLKMSDQTGDLEIDLSFGKGAMGNMVDAKLTSEYSELSVLNADNLVLKEKFSQLELGDVKNLEVESRYGKFEMGIIGVLKIDAQFSQFEISEIQNSLYLEANYVSEFDLDKLSASFTNVEIYGKFSQYDITLGTGLKAQIDTEFSFSDMRYDDDKVDINYKVREGNKNQYKGTIGGGDQSRKILVRSSYGDLKIK